MTAPEGTELGRAAVSPGNTLRVGEVRKTFSRGIWTWRRKKQVLRGVSFELAARSMVGLAGENGSGKSVLMRILAGSLTPGSGTVSIEGRLGYCPQIPMLCHRLTCDQTFTLFELRLQPRPRTQPGERCPAL